MHRIRKGLDLPIAGAPAQIIAAAPEVSRVALIADDFPGLKARVAVSVGQVVRRGELLLEDRAIPGVRHTAPAAGRVESINRGARRALQSIVIELSEGERRGDAPEDQLVSFSTPAGEQAAAWDRGTIRDLLTESGMWTAFRTRPFSKAPHPEAVPAAIFVTAMDTNPLAPDPAVVLADARASFEVGLRAVARLSGGRTYLCVSAGSDLAGGVDAPVTVEEFTGPHPAGTAGVHIHAIEPVSRRKTVWTIGYQDVISIGRLLASGHLDVSRVIAIGGPPVANPRLFRTRVGASIGDIARQEAVGGNVRWISGSMLSGKAADGDVFSYMGRFDLQLSVLSEGGGREFLAWLAPGLRKFSVLPVFLSKFLRGGAFDFSTDTHGSRRPIIPIGLYERVMPMDILPTFLLRALAVGDVERAEELGCLELDEEDLALCSFVDPGKTDFGPMLRHALDVIEREG